MVRNQIRNMIFKTLTPQLCTLIETWFDDAETIRFLGKRDWLWEELNLIQTATGQDFKGNNVLARHIWLVFGDDNIPVALVDVEPYNDGTAGMAFVVAPDLRGKGIGQKILLSLTERPELKNVDVLIAGVEPENISCLTCMSNAGFIISETPDEEGMLNVEKRLR